MITEITISKGESVSTDNINMGKDFKKELANLDTVFQAASQSDVKPISDFLQKYRDFLFWGVGSGGSYSIARVFEYFCSKAGCISKSLTPLELRLYNTQIKKGVAVLFTASGRNVDSKNAYRYLAEIEPEGLLTCCMHMEAPLKKMQGNNLHNYYFEYKMPVYKDGYLAVESLVSSLTLLSRAFEEMTANSFFSIPHEFKWNSQRLNHELLTEVLCRDSLIVLHGGITTPVAVDLESKFSEASLGNVQLVDFRNFAHGRHYWISNRKSSTAVIALVGTSEHILVDKTLALLPGDVPVLRLDVSDETIQGMLNAFDFCFELVYEAGVYRNINPGKPKVEEFGKRLYHINCNILNDKQIKTRKNSICSMATYRKTYRYPHPEENKYLLCADKYLRELMNSNYKGIVFDYDGTVHDKRQKSEIEKNIFMRINSFLESNIIIGFATGRGKSIREELRRVIPKKFWKAIVIAYYNGGCISTLDDDNAPNKKEAQVPKEFEIIDRLLKQLDLPESIKIDGFEDKNPYQLTILLSRDQEKPYIEQVKDLCAGINNIKVLASSHSIDIIPQSSSKNNIFSYLESNGNRRNQFLAIGDAGQFGGNDYELLKTGNSLSVDYVSDALSGCWNFAKPGIRNLEAALYYLDKIVVLDEGGFVLRGL